MVTFRDLSVKLGYDHPLRLAIDLKDRGLPLCRTNWQYLLPRTELEPIFAQLIAETVRPQLKSQTKTKSEPIFDFMDCY